MSFEIGQTAGGYEFVGLEDNTRTASYRVRNVVADRFEILRILPKEARQNGEQVDRFLREIKVHARLAHPNMVTFYNATEIDGQLVMTSELFEGTTLERVLEAGRLPWKEAVDYMMPVLAALGYAHEQGVTHREVSPANILLGADGAVKLSGFGLAKSAGDPQLTQTGVVMGWIEYMAPEQIKGLPTLDARSDLYAAGAILYEMVTGQVPFVRKSQFEVMQAHVSSLPEPPIAINSDLPPELSLVILTALEKDPDLRFQSAAEFREALERAANAPTALPEPLPDLLPEPVRADTADAAEEPWSFEKLLMAGGLTFLIVAIAFFMYLKTH